MQPSAARRGDGLLSRARARERELCESASTARLALPRDSAARSSPGAIALDTHSLQVRPERASSATSGPSLVGLTWGLFVGSFYPSMPKCSPHFVPTAPPEGEVRTSWPIALSFALLAGVDRARRRLHRDRSRSGLRVEQTTERVTRIVLAGTFAFGCRVHSRIFFRRRRCRAARELIDTSSDRQRARHLRLYTLHF